MLQAIASVLVILPENKLNVSKFEMEILTRELKSNHKIVCP